jgi:glycosyltransferase involved in cell wall biosynthesis
MDTVSVIITTKDEAKNIETCLRSITLQSYKNIEIILVDNNSTDSTKEIAKKYTNNIYNIGPERSAQRNLGVSRSKGKYVIYIDADMILSPSLIESCVRQGGALYIPEIVLGKGFFSQVRRFERSFYDGTVIDAVRFMPRDVILRAGGFDETLCGPEDWDLDKRVRNIAAAEVLNRPEDLIDVWPLKGFIECRGVDTSNFGCAIYHNESDLNLKKYLGKKTYYSLNMARYVQKWGDDADIKKQLGVSYRMFGVFIEGGKYKNLIAHPILAAGLYYLRFRVAINYLKTIF